MCAYYVTEYQSLWIVTPLQKAQSDSDLLYVYLKLKAVVDVSQPRKSRSFIGEFHIMVTTVPRKLLKATRQAIAFTALHGMQTRSSDEISVRPSVCQTRALWQKGRKII